MKYDRAEKFISDYKGLSKERQALFREAVKDFNQCAEAAARGESSPWSTALRVKSVRGSKGVWEMTFKFKDPDGRATWEWTNIDGEPAIRWRRVGDHGVFNDP